MPTNYWLKFGNTPLGYNGSGVQFTHVEQPGTLTVSLVGTGTYFDPTKNFSILVNFGEAISYTVDGTPVATPSATCTLTLHAGQSSVIGNIPFGTTYSISETISDEGYELDSITNSSGTMTDGGAISSVVTNSYHVPATLTITLNGTGTGFSTTKTFNVLVTFGSAISYSVNGTTISTPSDNYTASLKKGQSVILGKIPAGTTYVVTEQAISSADYNAGYSNGSVTNGSGTMTEGANVSAVANYTYDANTAVIGGTRYKTVTIGGKVWMAENLDYKYSGLSVGSSSSAASTSKLAWYYNNSEATYGRNGNKYGLLYNKAAAKYLEDNKATLIPGWHIPTSTEWQSGPLSSGASASYYKSTTGWSSGNGNNRTGFNAYPAGQRNTTNFRNVGSETFFFESNPTNQVYINTGDSVSETSSYSSYNAVSIRLVKD